MWRASKAKSQDIAIEMEKALMHCPTGQVDRGCLEEAVLAAFDRQIPDRERLRLMHCQEHASLLTQSAFHLFAGK